PGRADLVERPGDGRDLAVVRLVGDRCEATARPGAAGHRRREEDRAHAGPEAALPRTRPRAARADPRVALGGDPAPDLGLVGHELRVEALRHGVVTRGVGELLGGESELAAGVGVLVLVCGARGVVPGARAVRAFARAARLRPAQLGSGVIGGPGL